MRKRNCVCLSSARRNQAGSMARAGFIHRTSVTGGGVEDWGGVWLPARRIVALTWLSMRWESAERLFTVPGQWRSSDGALALLRHLAHQRTRLSKTPDGTYAMNWWYLQALTSQCRTGRAGRSGLGGCVGSAGRCLLPVAILPGFVPTLTQVPDQSLRRWSCTLHTVPSLALGGESMSWLPGYFGMCIPPACMQI